MGPRGPAEKRPVPILPTETPKPAPLVKWSQLPPRPVGGVGEEGSCVQLPGSSALPRGRNPWKKQAVFRKNLGEVQEIPCSLFNFPEPLLKSQML